MLVKRRLLTRYFCMLTVDVARFITFSRNFNCETFHVSAYHIVTCDCTSWHMKYDVQVLSTDHELSLRGVNVFSAVRGEYRACRWTEDCLLVSDKET
jgi:hypothetical protein